MHNIVKKDTVVPSMFISQLLLLFSIQKNGPSSWFSSFQHTIMRATRGRYALLFLATVRHGWDTGN